ncbi:MAG TPA: LapA family protein [Micromonosporaceae bacterium]
MTSSVPASGSTPVPEVAPAGTVPAKRRRVSPKFILVLVILAIVLWFALANTRDFEVKLWVKSVSAPVWLVLLCTFAVGLITGFLMRRRRRS